MSEPLPRSTSPFSFYSTHSWTFRPLFSQKNFLIQHEARRPSVSCFSKLSSSVLIFVTASNPGPRFSQTSFTTSTCTLTSLDGRIKTRTSRDGPHGKEGGEFRTECRTGDVHEVYIVYKNNIYQYVYIINSVTYISYIYCMCVYVFKNDDV